MKQLWILAGGNGAGKTTFYNLSLKHQNIPFVNADQIARELYPDDPEGYSYTAASIAAEMCRKLIHEGRSFCFETVMSHPSKVDFLAQAKALEYQVILVFIYLLSPELNKARVSQRVAEGGHNVPDEKIEERILRTIKNLGQAIPLCDRVEFYDNSSSEVPFLPVLTIANGQSYLHTESVPYWVRQLTLDTT